MEVRLEREEGGKYLISLPPIPLSPTPSEGRAIQLVPIKFQISILINKKVVKWGDKQKSGAFSPMQGPFRSPEKG